MASVLIRATGRRNDLASDRKMWNAVLNHKRQPGANSQGFDAYLMHD